MLDPRLRQAILAEAKQKRSFYLYDEKTLTDSIKSLQKAFAHEQLLYSVKCNPNRSVLKKIFSSGIDADAASLGEVYAAADCGVPSEHIFFSAPGKSREVLARSLGQCILIADSLREIRQINELAKERNMKVPIGVRINPNFTFTGNKGVPSKFGIDEDQFREAIPELRELSHTLVIGLHVHLQSQELDFRKLTAYYEKIFTMAARIQRSLNAPLVFLNLGGGIGIPYVPGEEPCDIMLLAKNLERLRFLRQDSLAQARILIESGRYLAGPCGWYVTHVVDTKLSQGSHIAILANTLNGYLRACIEPMLTKANPHAPAREPLFYRAGSTPFYVLNDVQEKEAVSVYGSLCTSADLVAEDAWLPKLSIGDVVAFPNAGAYGYVLTPFQFSTQLRPSEIYLHAPAAG